ncbi:MAG: hypothetical protein ACRDQZ_26720, partial [Mycobacteriales bacterium]
GLATLIIIFSVMQTVLFVLLLMILVGPNGNQSSRIYLLAGIALSVVALVSFAAVWQWRRLGAYLVGVVAVIGLFSDAVLGVPWVVLLVRICLLVALGTQIARRWELFR